MNIVFIGPFGLQPKSTMRVRALPLAKALVRRGHRLTLLLPPWDDPERAGQSWEDEGVQIVNVTLPGSTPGLFQFNLSYRLVARALALRPDVIHFFKPKAYAGLAHLALWGLRRSGQTSARLVLDTDDWEQDWNNILPYSTAQKKLFAWQEVWGLRHADAVTVASRALEQLVEPYRMGVLPEIHYLPNGYWPARTTTQRNFDLPDVPGRTRTVAIRCSPNRVALFSFFRIQIGTNRHPGTVGG